jgi:hypothetical protein
VKGNILGSISVSHINASGGDNLALAFAQINHSEIWKQVQFDFAAFTNKVQYLSCKVFAALGFGFNRYYLSSLLLVII